MTNLNDPLLQRLVPLLSEVPGIVGVVLGGSRARGTATANSDYDLGLYYGPGTPLATDSLLEVVSNLVDNPAAVGLTPVGGWGPWIVGGGWLSIGGRKVDLLYRSTEAVGAVIADCRAGRITMHYQPGHPHGFCSAIWMGEIALCEPLYDPEGIIAALKRLTVPYPEELRRALIQRFQWEVLFSIENGELAILRGEQTHIAGCAYRSLCCIAQVLFALNGRYLINEKAALDEAAAFPLTISTLKHRIAQVWQKIGCQIFGDAFAELRAFERELRALTSAAE